MNDTPALRSIKRLVLRQIRFFISSKRSSLCTVSAKKKKKARYSSADGQE